MKQDDVLVQRKSILAENDGIEGHFQLGDSPSFILSVSMPLSVSGRKQIFFVWSVLDPPQFAVKTFSKM